MSQLDRIRQQFKSEWQHYRVIELTPQLTELAADFADTFALRGYDAVQLASAAVLAKHSKVPITFACFDVRLNKAAAVLGMNVLAIE